MKIGAHTSNCSSEVWSFPQFSQFSAAAHSSSPANGRNLHGGFSMRVAIQEQPRLDCPPVDAVPLNVNCRDEIIPILRALQHIYSQAPLREEILDLIGKDVN